MSRVGSLSPEHGGGGSASVSGDSTLEVRCRLARAAFSLDVDLTLPGRGVTALFGPSGAGKTTLLRVIAGLERVRGGRVAVRGELWQDDATGAWVPVEKRGLGLVPQDGALFAHLTVRGNLAYGQRRRGVRDAEAARALEALADTLGIGVLLNRRPETLSGGERQRVSLARALLARPRLLVLDEPLASLDGGRRAAILPMIEQVTTHSEVPVLYVTHAIEEVVRLADHVVRLDAGRVVAVGPAARVLGAMDRPFWAADEPATIVEGVVTGRDATYGLLELSWSGGTLRLPHHPEPEGRRLRVLVRAREVGLSLQRTEGTSFLNMVPVVVRSIEPAQGSDADAQVIVRLDAGGVDLLAQVTRYSVDRLGMSPGATLWAQIKATSLRS